MVTGVVVDQWAACGTGLNQRPDWHYACGRGKSHQGCLCYDASRQAKPCLGLALQGTDTVYHDEDGEAMWHQGQPARPSSSLGQENMKQLFWPHEHQRQGASPAQAPANTAGVRPARCWRNAHPRHRRPGLAKTVEPADAAETAVFHEHCALEAALIRGQDPLTSLV